MWLHISGGGNRIALELVEIWHEADVTFKKHAASKKVTIKENSHSIDVGFLQYGRLSLVPLQRPVFQELSTTFYKLFQSNRLLNKWFDQQYYFQSARQRSWRERVYFWSEGAISWRWEKFVVDGEGSGEQIFLKGKIVYYPQIPLVLRRRDFCKYCVLLLQFKTDFQKSDVLSAFKPASEAFWRKEL